MYKGTILYVGGFELPDKNAAAHRVLNNAKIFRELGYRVVFCGLDTEVKPKMPTQTFDVLGFDSCPLPYPASTKQWMVQMFDVSRYMEMFQKYDDIQLVICYNLHAVPLMKLLCYCKKNHVKIAADCTEWHGDRKPKNILQAIKFVDFYLSMHWLQKKCDGMIAISSYLGDYYKKYMKNVLIVPPLVDLSDAKFEDIPRMNDEKVTTLTYSGSPCATKESLGDVVTVLNQLDDIDFKFRVVGVDYQRFCDMYGIVPAKDKIEFMGRVSHDVALRAVKESDYAIIIRPKTLLTTAGFPTKFAEAISCGTAVIANATSDLPQYLADGKNGHLVDENRLEEELRQILSAKEKPFVQRELFDYRAWQDVFRSFLGQMEL